MKRRVPVLYTDRDTWLHRRDPRAKLVGLGLLFLLIYLAPTWEWMLGGALLGLGLAAVARVPPKWLGVLVAIQLPQVGTYLLLPMVARALAGQPPLAGSFDFALKVVFSWQVALFSSAAVFTSMRLTELVDGFRGLGAPEVAAFTLEYVLLLFYSTLSDLFRVVDATKVKGLRVETRNPLTLARAVPKLGVPMFVTVLRKSNTLMAILRMRGYSFTERGELRTDLKFDAGDATFVAGCAAVLGVTAAVNFGYLAAPAALT